EIAAATAADVVATVAGAAARSATGVGVVSEAIVGASGAATVDPTAGRVTKTEPAVGRWRPTSNPENCGGAPYRAAAPGAQSQRGRRATEAEPILRAPGCVTAGRYRPT